MGKNWFFQQTPMAQVYYLKVIVGILAGTEKRELAEKWVDFMLSVEFQEDLPLQMFVFPVNSSAVLDETFIKYLDTPSNPSWVSPEDIASNREKWIDAWTETVLR